MIDQAKPLFAFGTLLDADVLQHVCAETMQNVHLQPAILPGHIQRYVSNELFPALVKDSALHARGALIHGLNNTMLQRIKDYEGDFLYKLTDIVVLVDDNVEQACQYFEFLGSVDVSDKTWDLAQWQALHKAQWMQMLRSELY